MAKLVVTTLQAPVVADSDTNLENAFLSGTEDSLGVPVAPKIDTYDQVSPALRPIVKQTFLSTIASLMVAFNLKRALPVGISATVTLAKLTGGGTNGSLTFVDGLLVSKVDPT